MIMLLQAACSTIIGHC